MPRLRTLKPGFFTNDLLAEVEPLGRLLFQGLWCIADREGRLADRPRRIKVEALPYDDCDVDALLDELARRGFIVRYSVDGERCVQVVNFHKHQTPHVKEAPSTIPPPPGYVPPPDWPDVDPDDAGPAPDDHEASTGRAPDEHGAALVPAPLLLGTSSGNLGVGTSSGNGRAVREVYSAAFETGWTVYPLKVGKHAAWVKWQGLIRAGEAEDRLAASCRHYGAECRRTGREARYILHGQTFFGPQRRYLDYVEGVPVSDHPSSLPKSWAALAAVRDHLEQGA